MLSQSMQDYLKTIYQLGEDTSRVTTNALAETLGVTAASVTGMLKKLADMKLVEYEPYQGVVLTLAGKKLALEVIRHHRLTELYLTEAMGFSWDRVHDEAERLEHAISEEFADKMAALLGDPQRDPHGSPIPSKEGVMASSSQVTLNGVSVGKTVRVERVNDESAELLRELADVGLVPGATVTLKSRNLRNDTLAVIIRAPGEPQGGSRDVPRASDPSSEGAPPTQSVTPSLAQQVFVAEL